MLVFAQSNQDAESFIASVIGKFVEIVINPLVYVGFTAALIIFIWGIIEFLAQGENPERASAGKQHMLWGIIGLFIFIASIAIVRALSNVVSGPNVLEG